MTTASPIETLSSFAPPASRPRQPKTPAEPKPLAITFEAAEPGDTTVMVSTELTVAARTENGQLVLRDLKDGATMTIDPAVAEMYDLKFSRPVVLRQLPAGFGALIRTADGDELLHVEQRIDGRNWLHEATGDRVSSQDLAESIGDSWVTVRHGTKQWVSAEPSDVYPGDRVRVEGPSGAIEGVVRKRAGGVVGIDIGVVIGVPTDGGAWFRLDARERTLTGPVTIGG